jgi:type II secretory pathway component PulJ
MTLVELLLAIVIGVLVLAVVGSLFHTVSVSLQAQRARRGGAEAAADALARVARDLECALVPAQDTAAGKLTLSADGTDLSFCTASLAEGEEDGRWWFAERVRYRLAPAGERWSALLRESRALQGPDAFAGAATNVLAEGLRSFRVTVFDGAGWQSEWPREESPPLPLAARIVLGSGAGDAEHSLETEVLIPAAHVFTSRVVRVSP